MPVSSDPVTFVVLGAGARANIEAEWGEKSVGHMHFDKGITIAALAANRQVGIISAYERDLPFPIESLREMYVDFLEVRPDSRRGGIARRLLSKLTEHAKSLHLYQIRAWSSEDKTEAIPMWKQLGFGLHPATTFPQGREVRGFYVTSVLERGATE